MTKINENEAILSKKDLHMLIGTAAGYSLLSYDTSDSLTDFCMRIASDTYHVLEEHIWSTEKIPEVYYDLARKMLRVVEEPDIAPNPAQEDKQAICRLLLAALQKTRAYHDLADLLYDSYSEKVQAKYAGGGCRLINTECDSGIAMINDILAHI